MRPLEADETIRFLIKSNMVTTYFDPKKREQMIDITEYGKQINDILNHMRTDLMDEKGIPHNG